MKNAPKTTLGLRHIALAVAAFALAAPAATVSASPADWFAGNKVQAGTGAVKLQNRALAPFSGVSLSLPANVELRIGPTESISIETDDNLLPLIETAIENGTLKIRPVKRNMSLKATSMRIVVQAKSVERLALGGSGSIRADALRGRKLDLDIGGSGTIDIRRIDADSLAVALGGSGSLKAGGGNVRSLSLSIGGSGDVDLGRVATDRASVSVAGSGTATVWAKRALDATIAGSGDVNYHGDPQVSRTVVGSGNVVRLGSAPR